MCGPLTPLARLGVLPPLNPGYECCPCPGPCSGGGEAPYPGLAFEKLVYELFDE
jgi:hypothetical protein